ncbi:hypothetical protein DUK53_16010 [Listeria sp. SHR_NRA_18]|uniref:hypothetical protein n=1 Tax=Listeria sp. SHR_NRA_18 TaxID=2269046 RepID=UPI000F5D8366|nr:hypothetical protein [Listeria sp. SHR_NRA_18]RQW65456.1 hypothetical protein DUK53_16010 [Listeria sp. SHR_NRA_18]
MSKTKIILEGKIIRQVEIIVENVVDENDEFKAEVESLFLRYENGEYGAEDFAYALQEAGYTVTAFPSTDINDGFDRVEFEYSDHMEVPNETD